MEKVAFLPFGLLIDQWRWRVFSGEIAPADYNKAWWDLRLKYQGVAPPSPRGEELFDPGAKYHVPANYSYTRYFLAYILQFQFHRELSKIAGCTAPLHRCSIYENKAVGSRLDAMLKMGQSRAVARRARGARRHAPDGRDGDRGLLRAAQDVARRADEREADGVVRSEGPRVSLYFVASFAASFVLSIALSIFSPAFSAGPFSGHALVARATADRAATMMMVRMIFMPLIMLDLTAERLFD